MTTFIKVLGSAVAIVLMSIGLLVSIALVGVWYEDPPTQAEVLVEGPSTEELAGQALTLVQKAAARMRALEYANGQLGAMLRESTEKLSKSQARVLMLEEFMNRNGVPTPADTPPPIEIEVQ